MSVETRDAVRKAALDAGVRVGRPVSLAALIRAAVTVADREALVRELMAAEIKKENS